MNGLEFVFLIVFLSMVKGTVHKYLDYRIRVGERQGGAGERHLTRAIEEVRAEVAALKRRETDAILSFDSTLQTLDARVKHLERSALGQGAPERSPLNAGEGRGTDAAPAVVAGEARR